MNLFCARVAVGVISARNCLDLPKVRLIAQSLRLEAGEEKLVVGDQNGDIL